MLITSLSVEEVEFMPKEKQPGILYISDRFKLAIHICPCGCGDQSVMSFDKPDGWKLTLSDGAATFFPSVLNRFCNAHYWIQSNKIVAA